MKKLNLSAISFLVLLSVPFGYAPLARSDDGFHRPGHEDRGKECKDGKCQIKPACFNVFCRYHRDDGHERDFDRDKDRDHDHDQDRNRGHGRFNQCSAAATFDHWVGDDGTEVWGNSEGKLNPTFSVECDNNVIFNGAGHRFTDRIGTRIQAVGSPFPAILLPRSSLNELHHYTESSLELPDQKLTGFCFVYTGPALE